MSIIVEQITTVDGFTAEPDGGLSFTGVTGDPNQADHVQLEMLRGVDAIVFGRVTYELFASYWPTPAADPEAVAEPIRRLPKYVVSSTLHQAPWGGGEIDVLRPDPDAAQAVSALASRVGTVIVWGSLTLTDALFAAGAVDRLRVRTSPVLIGRGRPLAGGVLNQLVLSLTSSTPLPSGDVVTEYAVGRQREAS